MMKIYLQPRAKMTGVTFIEVIICMTIITILSTFAYSNYTQYLTRSRRLDAHTGLFNIRSYFEQQYITHRAYPLSIPERLLKSDYYTYRLLNLPSNNFQITATPSSNGPQIDDRECQSISIDNKGLQSAGNGQDPVQNKTCWNR